ncbi:MAG: hypothetical protein KGJ32_02045 [Xanthomonadaceae bacterium]|nr:hypothetical protein [Xanthomonadaceae bacterium]
MSMFETHLTTVFCEDVRQEIGGKITLVGVFNGICGINSFPVTLPKIAVMLRVIGPMEAAPDAIGFKAWLGETLIAEVPVTPVIKGVSSEIENQIEIASGVAPRELQFSGKFKSMTSFLVFAPLHVEGPTVLRIRAYGPEGEEYPAPSLTFVSNEGLSAD